MEREHLTPTLSILMEREQYRTPKERNYFFDIIPVFKQF
jgi:hypothetical protein